MMLWRSNKDNCLLLNNSSISQKFQYNLDPSYIPGPGHYDPPIGFSETAKIKANDEKTLKLKGKKKESLHPDHSFISKVQRFSFNK